MKKMTTGKIFLIANCLVVFLALYKEVQAQLFGFNLEGSGSDNECYVQCPMECPHLNLNMVDCVVYCKMKCACAADDSDCITKAMDKMQKAADERDSAIGPEEEAAAESPGSDAPSAEPDEEATDGFATEDGEQALPPGAMAPEIDTTSSVIEMDISPKSSDAEAPESQGPAGAAATPQSVAAPESQDPAAATPQSAAAPASQGPAAATPQSAAPASQGPAAATPQSASATVSQGPAAATPQSATAPTPNGAVSPTTQTAASPAQRTANAPAPI